MQEVEFKTLTEEELEKVYKLRDIFIAKHNTQFKRLLPSQKRFSDRIIKSVLNNEGAHIVAEFSRQSGKTTVLALTINFLQIYYFSIMRELKLSYMGFFNTGIFAPQKEQSKTDFDKIKDFLDNIRDEGYGFELGEFNGNTIKVNYGKFISTTYCFSASPTSKTESKTLHLIVHEECQDLIDSKIDVTIAPMGASTNATNVFIGTAGYKRCRFLEKISLVPDDCKVIAPYTVALKEREDMFKITGNPAYLNYQKHINERLGTLGEDSDAFQTQYALKWILERGQFISYEELVALEAEYRESLPTASYGSGMTLYGGIDWGKASDSTVFTVVTDDGKIIYWKEFHGDDYSTQIRVIKEIIKAKFQEALKTIYCDSTGNQDMGVDVLRSELAVYGINVRGINFNPQSKDFMYKNLSALMKPIIVNEQIIRPAMLKIPKVDTPEKDKFIRQFCDLQKEIKGGMWRCNHPDGTYKDDFCDSMALACYGLKARGPSKGRFWGVR